MELTALIEALKQIKTDKYPIEIWTDSKYVLDGITKWIKNWKKNEWKTANKKEVKNKLLWQALDELMNKYNVEIRWVKAHADDKFNNLVDKIARQKASEI
jgi:ribonuclease HI